MRRQMQLRPSQGGKFRGPVGAPLPEENPAKAALARLPWPLSTRDVKARGLKPLIIEACRDGYVDPDTDRPVWNLTEKGAALLGVKPPGFRKEFAEAGRAVMDVIQKPGPFTHDIGNRVHPNIKQVGEEQWEIEIPYGCRVVRDMQIQVAGYSPLYLWSLDRILNELDKFPPGTVWAESVGGWSVSGCIRLDRYVVVAIPFEKSTSKPEPTGPNVDTASGLRFLAELAERTPDIQNVEVNIGGPPLPMGDAKPVRYDPMKARALDRYANIEPPKFSPVGDTIHVWTGRQEVRVRFDRPVMVVAETAALGTLLLSTILEVRDRVREAMRNGAPTLPPGTKAVDDGFLISVVPNYVVLDGVDLIIDVRRI